MKQTLKLFISGIAGGLVVLFAMQFIQPSTSTDAAAALETGQFVKHINVPAGNAPATIDFTTAADKAMPAVVHIEASAKANPQSSTNQNPFQYFFGDDLFRGNPFGNYGPKQGTGSGVFISNDGYIVTNRHVVSFADDINVTLYDNRKFKATLVGSDEQTDLAVLKIEGYDFPTLEYGDSDDAKVGEWVLAVGNPFDLTSTVTAGIISAKGRNISIIPNGAQSIEAFIQTDAAVNPGNSGGALVDTDGNLIGINTAIATRTGTFSGYSFAIPVNMMEKIVDDIIKYGEYQRGFLGISIQDMDADLAQELGIEQTQGVYVHQLVEGGAAEYAGIEPQDVIVAVGNKKVKSVPELQELVGRSKIGDVLTVKVNRKGKMRSIDVKLMGQITE